MQRSTIPLLVISLLFSVALTSCAPKLEEGFTAAAIDRPVYDVPYFANPDTDYVYKANITVYGHELGGIFIAKKINKTTHRVVFTTEFGNKLLDFEISETDFKVNSIVAELDKKILINTLKEDFRLLLRQQYAVIEQFKIEGQKVYKSRDGKGFNYLFLSETNGRLLKILHTSARNEKTNLKFVTESDMFANQIIIDHKNIKLNIEFNYFKPD